MQSFAVALHVVTAILGLGQIAGMAVVASTNTNEATVPQSTWRALERLVRGATWSLLVMLLTGILIAYLVGFELYGKHLWLRASFAATLVIGALNGTLRRALKNRPQLGEARVMKRVATSAWIMCALLAVIATLMELKPT
jgi:uncharacterized protein YfaQ (DUF2300 family)